MRGYPLFVFVLSLFALWLSTRIGASFLRRQRNQEQDIRELNKAIPAMMVARYLQIESKIRAAITFELAARIPLVN